MNDPPKNEDRELIDMLIAISVVSRHLARKLEMKGSETDHEPDERPGNDPGRDDTDRESTDRMRRKPDQSSNIYAALARSNAGLRGQRRPMPWDPDYVPLYRRYCHPGIQICAIPCGIPEGDQDPEEQTQSNGKHRRRRD